ncbi:DNA polymerase III, delta prime subunit [Methylophilus rhizosphaerae]|uniref:DNA polymerase III subunit delta' n=1 Tax=Methylophilus rhizosphaerae TaxID=492660 RepID=A0A1G8Z868_9PROT|nr:DNA polymerase III subunit delta' [Methylophilus rhizosphaerae]SDK11286.1 DNA polymerase III, delta prime subunit [Methylophilus rhizosphaerae]
MINNIYPWQEALFSQWMHAGTARHHALLLHGKAGIGKLAFAQAMAASLLCLQPQANAMACGECGSCHWLSEGAHPDFREITPEDDDNADGSKKKTRKRQQILIDQIRALNDYLALTSHRVDGMRVVLIHPLEAMNVAASNALLKLLEEPPQRTQFLLVSHQRQALLPTILSRCMQVDMPVPTREQGLQWLQAQSVTQPEWIWHYSGGAPTSVQQEDLDWYVWYQQWSPHLSRGSAMDIVAAGPVLLKQGMEHAIQVLQKWLLDIWLARHAQPLRYHPSEANTLQMLAAKLDVTRLLAFQQQLNRFKMTAQHSLNQELQLEQLLLQYKKLFG